MVRQKLYVVMNGDNWCGLVCFDGRKGNKQIFHLILPLFFTKYFVCSFSKLLDFKVVCFNSMTFSMFKSYDCIVIHYVMCEFVSFNTVTFSLCFRNGDLLTAERNA